MAKRDIDIVGREVTLTSAVVITVTPFPVGLYERIQERTLEDFPDPDPEDPDYDAKLAEVEQKRTERMGEATLDFCVNLDLEPWEPTIRRLERYRKPFPEDPDDRRVAFLTSYALASMGDYETVTYMALSQTAQRNENAKELLKPLQAESKPAKKQRRKKKGG